MALSGSTTKKYSGSAAFWVWVEWTATQDIANNTSTITAITYGGSNSYGYYSGTNRWHYTTIDGTQTSQKATVSWAASTTKKELNRQTKTINHNADGTRDVTISGKWNTGSNPEGSFFSLTSTGDFTLDPIARASVPTLSASSGNLGTAVTINTNRASTNFTHYIYYNLNGNEGEIATSAGASVVWTPPASLANHIPNATSATVIIGVDTWNGSTYVGYNSITYTINVPNDSTFKPTAAITAINEGAAGLTVFAGTYVQGKTKLTVSSTATPKYGATITQTKVTVDGSNYYGSPITTSVINTTGLISVLVTVTDSRGYSGTFSQTVTITAYSPPKINLFDADRTPNAQGSNLLASLDYAIAPVANKNTKSYKIEYRIAGVGTYTTLTTSTAYYANATTYANNTGVLNPNNSYEIKFTVADYFGSESRVVTVGTAFTLIDYHSSGTGMSFGKVAEKIDAIEMDLPFHLSKPLIFDTTDIINQQGNFGIYDTRSIAPPTQIGNRGVRFDLKANGIDALSDGGTYHTAMTIQNWSDSSGGKIHQLGFTDNSNVWYRAGVVGGSWGAWKNLGSSMSDADIKAAILRVDGSGSTVDSDTVDGIHASAFEGIHLSRSGDHLNGYQDLPGNLRKCWRTVTMTITASEMGTTGPTGMYKSGWKVIGNWPASFTAAPRLTGFVLTCTSLTWPYLGTVLAPSATAAGDFFILKHTANDSPLIIYVEAVGPR